MQPLPLRKLLFHWKQDIAALAVVAIYVAMALLLVLAWGYLTEKADAFISDAKRINRDELADMVRFQLPPAKHVRNSAADIFGADPSDVMGLRGNPACGKPLAARCKPTQTILPQ